ncbi:uncharacterized protein LOC125236738 [Leguminivora glycinivorella]|uniref:uncharacterized protein LOC125236738 n=1 Tax=Leguminivora glycinivorella TaxID=1035111 RepID=UPI0020104156|nr:uncharacterized protein LOC125236738 [Leguminivora glycinivorella]
MISQTFKILVLILITPALSKKVKLGPHWDHHERTSCSEFGQYARFNPYSITNETWMVFYYWAPQPDNFLFHFTLPTKENYTYLHHCLDDTVTVPVNWTAKHVMLRIGGDISLLVETGDRGQYLMYNVRSMIGMYNSGGLHTPLEIRMKQTGDNKIVGMMVCKKEIVFALTRVNEVPPRNELQDAANRLNYRSRGGKSYLYQGHHWMPIPEMDESAYWGERPDHFTADTIW